MVNHAQWGRGQDMPLTPASVPSFSGLLVVTFGLLCLGMTDRMLTTVLTNKARVPFKSFNWKSIAQFSSESFLTLGCGLREGQ